jgi:hypothetical protein
MLIAFCASAGLFLATNAKPLERPVSLSLTKNIEATIGRFGALPLTVSSGNSGADPSLPTFFSNRSVVIDYAILLSSTGKLLPPLVAFTIPHSVGRIMNSSVIAPSTGMDISIINPLRTLALFLQASCSEFILLGQRIKKRLGHWQSLSKCCSEQKLRQRIINTGVRFPKPGTERLDDDDDNHGNQ